MRLVLGALPDGNYIIQNSGSGLVLNLENNNVGPDSMSIIFALTLF